MNKIERKNIVNYMIRLNDIEIGLSDIRDEIQERYDSKPVSYQESEEGKKMQKELSILEDVECSLSDIISKLENV